MFFAITKRKLHHAYLIEGDARELAEPLLEHLEVELGIPKEGNPNTRVIVLEMFDIAAAKEIRAASSMTGFSGNKRVYIIGARAFTHEAQNALLKTLEEPGEGVLFFLIVPSKELVIPTVRSRLFLMTADAPECSPEDLADAERFFNGDTADRLTFVAKIYQEEDRDLARDNAKTLLTALLVVYARQVNRDSRYLERLITTRRRLYSRSPSLKLLLEDIALTLPKKVSVKEK